MKTELSSVLVLGKITRILDFLTANTAPVSISAMSRTLAIPRATLYRLLESLAAQEIIVQRGGRYQVGSHLLMWSARAMGMSVRAAAFPHMPAVRDSLGLTVSLHIPGSDCRICIERVETGVASASVLSECRIGEPAPLHQCASGAVLAAWLPAEQRARILHASQLRFPAILAEERSEEAWNNIRQRGWAMKRSGRNEENAGLAVPVFDDAGVPVATLMVSGSSEAFFLAGRSAEMVARVVLDTTAKIHQMTGARMVA